MEPRNYLANASATPPTKPGSPSSGYPQAAVPGVSEATTPGPFWFYKIGEEMRTVLVGAGLTPSDDDLSQLLSGIRRMSYLGGSLAKDATYTVDVADIGKWINVDATAGAVVIDLPAEATAKDGFVVAIEKTDTTAAVVEVKDDAATSLIKLESQGDKVIAFCDGNTWHIKVFKAPTTRIFTASDTYTKPAGLKKAIIHVLGGGGGGGGSTGGSGQSCGGGGGGGEYARKEMQASAIQSTETVTVGAGGAGGANGGGAGSSGGTSSFGAHVTVLGGSGGSGGPSSVTTQDFVNGGSGGTGGSGGDISVDGSGGESGRIISGLATNSNVGGGGGGPFGGGRERFNGANAPGSAGVRYGGGGNGAHSTSTSYSGGSGADGLVIVEEYY